MNVKKKLVTLGLVGVMAMGQCMSAFAAAANSKHGIIYTSSGAELGKWKNEMTTGYVNAETWEKNQSTKCTRIAYISATTTSVYSNTGSYSHYKNVQLNKGEKGSYNGIARARITFPATEVGKLAYTKHLIIINGSAYAPTDAYTSNSGVKIKP